MSGLSLDIISLVYFKSRQQETPGDHRVETKAGTQTGVMTASRGLVSHTAWASEEALFHLSKKASSESSSPVRKRSEPSSCLLTS